MSDRPDRDLVAFARSAPRPELVGDIAVRRFGAGLPLLLVHGGSGSWTHWIGVLGALSREHAVTAIDLPGFGDAPAPTQGDPDRYLDRVVESIAAAIGGDRFDVAGFSFGATIGAAVANRLHTRVRRLSLLGPGGFGEPIGRDVAPVKVPAHSADPEGHAAALAINLGRFMLASQPDADSAVVRIHMENVARLRYDSRKLSFQDRIIGDLKAIRCPLQVIWGAVDKLAYPSIEARAARIRSVRPDARIEVIPGAAHWVQFDAAERVTQLLLQFHAQEA